MRGCELRVDSLDVAAGFANHFRVANHGVLDDLAGQEANFVNIFHVSVNALDGFKDVPR